MRTALVNVLALAAMGLLVAAGFVVHLALGLFVAALVCGVLYLAFSDGKGLGS